MYVSEIERIRELHLEMDTLVSDLEEANGLLECETRAGGDPEMEAYAREEAANLACQQTALASNMAQALEVYLAAVEATMNQGPRDPALDSPDQLVLEVRAGAGGDEAGIFADELLRMYERYCKTSGWDFQHVDRAEKEGGGVKEAVAMVEGAGCFPRLRFESGVHRVQRVPATDAKGRIHTSTVTIAVLPQAESVDGITGQAIQIPASDLQIDTYKASGAGGQHVNTTDSAVRMTHLPTGLVVSCQSQRSQHQNRAYAIKVLRAKLAEQEREKIQEEHRSLRANAVGTGDRSEKIRTYNFKDTRVTDHRAKVSVQNLEKFLQGDRDTMDKILDELIDMAKTSTDEQ